jgi:hypothetical protein
LYLHGIYNPKSIEIIHFPPNFLSHLSRSLFILIFHLVLSLQTFITNIQIFIIFIHFPVSGKQPPYCPDTGGGATTPAASLAQNHHAGTLNSTKKSQINPKSTKSP